MASASTSTMPLGASQSLPSSRRSSETQRILSSFAVGRPLPYGQIPLRRTSGSSTKSAIDLSVSPQDVNLSGIEGFDYDYETWGITRPSLPQSKAARKRAKAKALVAPASISSPSLPIGTEEVPRRILSRSSNASSRRSSMEGKIPRLLQQSISPPTTSSQAASAVGRPSMSVRGSKSLAEKGEKSALPSLYDVSRGRSAHVSLGRRWEERRGASASVLSGADGGDGKGEDDKSTPKGSSARKSGGGKKSRMNSCSSLEPSLFGSEDSLSLSSEDDEERECNASRRSSMEKDRRRGLRVLLAPSVDRRESSEEQTAFSQSVTTSASEEQLSERHGSLASTSISSNRADTTDVLEFSTSYAMNHGRTFESADDDSEASTALSALLVRRRSRSGRRLLGSLLGGSSSEPSGRTTTRLEAIPAGLTPDGLSDARFWKVPVENEADPLLGSAISVADMMAVDPVEWNDQQKQSRSPSIGENKTDRRQNVAEQERERRMGFAAAYQQRLASLLWSKETPVEKNEGDTEEKVEESGNLLTSSWRHILRLPNLLLMPTLGPSRTRALMTEEATQGVKSGAADTKLDESSVTSTMSSHSPPASASTISLPSSDSSSKTVGEASEFRRRGVMNPLEGDSDVSAYVSGLGLPIDPDLELSSVVHLQTFRTTYKPKSRRGSLEKPTTSGDTVQHRRSYSDNRVEPDLGLTLQNLRSEAFGRGMFGRKKDKAVVSAIVDERRSKSSLDERRCSSDRDCSRPAVQAPVPGGYSAYNSSDSGEEDERVENDSRRTRSQRESVKEKSSRGRESKTRRRSSSPPTNRSKQCAIGLFESRRPGRGQKDQQEEEEEVSLSSPMIRIRSTPNLPSLTRKQTSKRSRADGRGREDSVKVVSASLASEEEEGNQAVTSKLPSVLLPPSSIPFSGRPALGLGLPSNMNGRPCMVSNGAHLLMLSLELEMMRHRKITCSLKPRWLKARVRSENSIRMGGGLGDAEGEVERRFSSPTCKPKLGSSLRFEVVPS